MRACACAKLARSAQPPIISGSHGIHWTCSIVIHAVVLLYFNVIFKARIRLLGLAAFADRIPDERCWLTGAAERMDVGEYRGKRWFMFVLTGRSEWTALTLWYTKTHDHVDKRGQEAKREISLMSIMTSIGLDRKSLRAIQRQREGFPRRNPDWPTHWPSQEIPLVYLQTFDTCLKINRYILTTHYNLFWKSIFLTF